MVRNPYAMAESLLRANPKASIQDIGNHVLNCLTIQRKNCYLRGNNLIFTYEDMCNRPEWVEQQVKDRFKIEDFSLSVNKTGKDSQEKLSFIIGLTFKEARLLREYMVYIIHDLFANPIKQNPEPESSGEESPAETSVSAPVPTPAPKQAQQSITDDIDF